LFNFKHRPTLIKNFVMAFLEIFLGVVVLCVALILRYLLRFRGYLETLGIPLVKPILFFGSPPFVPHKLMMHEHSQEMHQKLGKTWAKYEGSEPTIVTIDPDLIKAIMVKHFDSFSDIINWEYADHQITLDLSGGEQWKALRKVMSPTFSSGKLKSMMEPMDAVVDNLVSHLEKEIKKNPVVSVKEVFQCFALDTIAVCSFGINTNSFENPDNDILTWGKKLFSGFICTNWVESG
jgi:cytochrome P450 family 6